MRQKTFYNASPAGDLREMLRASCARYGDRTAFLLLGGAGNIRREVSYREFKDDVDALGTALLSLGLGGRPVGLVAENRYEWAVTYLATVNGAGVIVPLDRELPPEEIENMLGRARVAAVFFAGKYRDHIVRAAGRLGQPVRLVDMDGAADAGAVLSFANLLDCGRALLGRGERNYLDAAIDPEAPGILLFTSGTTSRSKAVMLSHRNIAANVCSMAKMVHVTEQDVFLSVLPLHHTYEGTAGFLLPLSCGAAIAHCRGLRHIAADLRGVKATVLLGVPLLFETMYRQIWSQTAKTPGRKWKLELALAFSSFLRRLGLDLRQRLFAPVRAAFGGRLRLLISGAAAIDPAVARGFRNFGFGFLQGYGLTECAPLVAVNRLGEEKDGAAGIVLPDMMIEIDAPDAAGVGEIVVKGPNVMLGYYEDAAATAAVLRDGWLRTGDLGYIDADGYLFITGRKKNVIITKSGKNIYPEEIEALLNRSPYIKESLVFGQADPAAADIVVTAVIVPDLTAIQATAEPTEEFLRTIMLRQVREVNKKLVSYMHIRRFSLASEELPKTTTQKIKRSAAPSVQPDVAV